MADYRTIQSKIYRDDWFSRQEVDAKFLFIYLFTNPSASVAGIYELPIRFVSVDTGISEDRVREILAGFQDDGKVEWCEPLIWIKKMREYQATNSPALKLRIQRDLAIIPDCELKLHHAKYYHDPLPTVPRPSKEPPIKTDKTDPIRNNTDKRGAAPPPAPEDNAVKKNGTSAKTPAVMLYHSEMRLWPNPTQDAAINATVTDIPLWQAVVKAWRLRGNKPTNVEGLLDWYKTGIPEGKPQQPQGRQAKQTSSQYEQRWAEHVAKRNTGKT